MRNWKGRPRPPEPKKIFYIYSLSLSGRWSSFVKNPFMKYDTNALQNINKKYWICQYRRNSFQVPNIVKYDKYRHNIRKFTTKLYNNQYITEYKYDYYKNYFIFVNLAEVILKEKIKQNSFALSRFFKEY